MAKKSMKLDRADCRILEILQESGRITNTRLSTELGISPSPMLERVRKLEKHGYIDKYVALVRPEKLGKEIIAIISVSLAVHQSGALQTFTEAVALMDEVLECYHISGNEDFVLKVVVRDIDAYRRFVVEKLTPVGGISQIRTSFVLDTVKFSTKIPVDDIDLAKENGR